MKRRRKRKYIPPQPLSYADVEKFLPIKTSEDLRKVFFLDLRRLKCYRVLSPEKRELVTKLIINVYNTIVMESKIIFHPGSFIDVPEENRFYFIIVHEFKNVLYLNYDGTFW